jgi:hypothetical protein
MSTSGSVTGKTVTAFTTCNWSAASGGELVNKLIPGLVVRPKVGASGAWGIVPPPTGVATIDQATFNAICACTPNADGSFTDTSNSLSGGANAVYNLIDNGSGACVAVAQS